MRRFCVVGLGLLLVSPAWPQEGRPQEQAAAKDAGSRMRGLWFQSLHNADGSMLDYYETFAGENGWTATTVYLAKSGEVKRHRVWGTYTLKAVADGRFQLVTLREDWSPRHRCVEKGQCQTLGGLEGGSREIDFPDRDHMHMVGQTLLAVRLELAPIEAAVDVPHVLMVTATGEPSYAPVPVGLYSIPGRQPHLECDNLQAERVCVMTDGHLSTDARGCKVCGP